MDWRRQLLWTKSAFTKVCRSAAKRQYNHVERYIVLELSPSFREVQKQETRSLDTSLVRVTVRSSTAWIIILHCAKETGSYDPPRFTRGALDASRVHLEELRTQSRGMPLWTWQKIDLLLLLGAFSCEWLGHYATSRKVVGSRSDEVTEFLQFT
jgi:hypothetical protein